jgi:hypothetical protein
MLLTIDATSTYCPQLCWTFCPSVSPGTTPKLVGALTPAIFFEVIMGRPTVRTDKMIEELIDRVSAGETLTAICKLMHMPSLRSLMSWLRLDDDLDSQMHRARIRGTLLQADEAVDTQRKVMSGKLPSGVDPRMAQAMITAANNMGHQANARLTRIDKRFSDKSEVKSIGPVIIGWEQPQPPPERETKGGEALEQVASEMGLRDAPVAGEA